MYTHNLPRPYSEPHWSYKENCSIAHMVTQASGNRNKRANDGKYEWGKRKGMTEDE